jgi:hypothetical protein
MGFSWALEGRVEVAASKVDALRERAVDPAKHTWPDTWGEPNEAEPRTFEEVIGALEEAEVSNVEWTETGVRVAAVFSDDSSLWLDLRSHLLAAALVAGELGGKGDFAITGWLDGGPDDVFRAHAKKGESDIDVLTARDAEKIAKRVHRACEPLVEQLVAAQLPTVSAFDWPPRVAELHARVCAELGKHPTEVLTRALAPARVLANRKKKFGYLTDLFTGAEVLPVLASGWPEMEAHATHTIPAAALATLARIDVEAARTFMADVLALPAASAEAPVGRAYRAEARALAMTMDSADACKRAIASMRGELPKLPHFTLHRTLADAPFVRRLREARSRDVHAAAREALAALIGGKGVVLSDAHQVYAYALTLVLEPTAEGDDQQLLFRLWTDSGGFMLLDHYRILAQGDPGRAYMASLFGRSARSQYAVPEQSLAARARFAIDPDGALEIARKLLAAPRDHAAECSIHELCQALAEGEPRPVWTDLLVEAAGQEGTGGAAALATLARWNHPGLAELVLQRLGSGATQVDAACAMLEQVGDATVSDALAQHLAGLPKTARRDRNRIQQCLEKLGVPATTSTAAPIGTAKAPARAKRKR